MRSPYPLLYHLIETQAPWRLWSMRLRIGQGESKLSSIFRDRPASLAGRGRGQFGSETRPMALLGPSPNFRISGVS